MKLTLYVAVLVLLGGLNGCTQLEKHARDTAAALNGAITQAQQQHQQECNATPTLAACIVINKAVDGQNALVTAIEAYCGWSVANPPVDMAATQCVPVKSAQAGLQTAVANADLFIAELKGVIK